jgi:APA family basic amino acid/polyamine antiporter
MQQAGQTLRRELGLLDAVAIGFGAIVGAGIYVVTGLAAGSAGPAFLIALVIAGLAAAANALSSAQLAAAYPQSGGTYEYGYRVLGPAAGFAAGCMFLISKLAAAGTVALGLAAYVDVLLPGTSPRIIAVAAVALFTALNYAGIRRSSRVNIVIVTVSVGALLAFIIFGAFHFDGAQLRPFAPHGWRAVLQAAALLFFAYTGYARVATLGEEVRDPARTIPRAIIITVVGAIALYLATGLIAIGVAGAESLARTGAPLHTAALATGSAALPLIIALGAIAAMLGVILSQVLGLSRVVLAMSRRGDLPAPLAAVHARFGTPHRAVLAVGVVAAIIAATGTLAGVAAAATFAILVYYAITNVAALRMPAPLRLYPRFIAYTGLVACSLLALSLPLPTILTGTALLAAAFAARLLLRRM